MGWLREFRSSIENPATPLSYPAEWLLDIFNGGRTDSGIRVSELTALQVGAVYSCVDLISGGLAALNLNVYERLTPRGKRLAFEQDLHFILHDEPNEEMTSFSFIKTMQCHALLWTNCYAEIQRDNANRPVALWPRNPNATRPRRLTAPYRHVSGDLIPAGTMVYITTDGSSDDARRESPERTILSTDMIHIPGLSLDGRLGKPIVEMTRQMIGLALAAEKFGGKYFANGLRPTGVFEVPQDMGPVALENFKRSIQEAYGGENMMRPMVSEAGIKWTESHITNNEAQFIATREYQRAEIASIYHVPVRMLGDGGKSNRATAEQEAIEFVQWTLRPWINAWEQELRRKLFPRQSGPGRPAKTYYPGFYYQDLLLPDADSRGKLISLLKQWGIANTDDIRDMFLDWNPVGGKAGQTYWMPVNMMDAEKPLELAPPDPNAGDPAEDEKRMLSGYCLIFARAFREVCKAEHRDAQRVGAAFAPVLEALADLYSGSTIDAAEGAMGKFIGDYVGGLTKRVAAWTDNAEVCQAEFARAARAVKIAAYREVATNKAKGEIDATD